MTFTLRRLASCLRPPESVAMTFSLRARILSMSSLGGGNSTPQSCRSSSTSAMTRATCSRAFDGMQPRKQAGAAQPRIGLDERDFQPFIGGQERGRVAAGTAAENNERGVHGAGIRARSASECGLEEPKRATKIARL